MDVSVHVYRDSLAEVILSSDAIDTLFYLAMTTVLTLYRIRRRGQQTAIQKSQGLLHVGRGLLPWVTFTFSSRRECADQSHQFPSALCHTRDTLKWAPLSPYLILGHLSDKHHVFLLGFSMVPQLDQRGSPCEMSVSFTRGAGPSTTSCENRI